MLKFKVLSSLLAILLVQSGAITKVKLVDHDDPDYTDRCLEITGELCDYCCLVDFEWCSRDIYNCEPIVERDLSTMFYCLMTLTGVIVGCPFLSCFLKHCMLSRFCARCYPTTFGISCFELICRCLYYSFYCKRFNTSKKKEVGL